MKKLILNESLKSFEDFVNTYSSDGTDITSTVENTEPLSNDLENKTNTKSNNTDIPSEIDTILAKLKDLETNMDETLNSYEEYATTLNEDELNEDAEKLKDFVFIAPRVRKMQQKANKIRLNKVDLEFAIANAPSDKKQRLQGKAKDLGKDITELEDSIDDYQKNAGATYSLKIKSMERIKGKLSAIKRKTGLEDDPKKKTNLKTQMQNLADDFKEEAAAAKELQKKGPSAEEIKVQKEKAKKEQKPAANQNDGKPTPTTDDGEPTPTTNTGKPEPTTNTGEPEPKAKGQTEQTPQQKAKNSKEGMIKRYKDLLAKTDDDAKKAMLQQKIDDLQEESWELFLDDKYVAIVEAELVEFEKAILS